MTRWGATLGATATALLCMAWVFSGWWSYGMAVGGGVRLGIARGLLLVQNQGLSFRHPVIDPGVSRAVHARSWTWWGHYHREPGAWEVGLPLWVLIALASAATAVLLGRILRESRRRRTGSCAACGYRLDGLGPDAPCPECGKPRER